MKVCAHSTHKHTPKCEKTTRINRSKCVSARFSLCLSNIHSYSLSISFASLFLFSIEILYIYINVFMYCNALTITFWYIEYNMIWYSMVKKYHFLTGKHTKKITWRDINEYQQHSKHMSISVATTVSIARE